MILIKIVILLSQFYKLAIVINHIQKIINTLKTMSSNSSLEQAQQLFNQFDKKQQEDVAQTSQEESEEPKAKKRKPKDRKDKSKLRKIKRREYESQEDESQQNSIRDLLDVSASEDSGQESEYNSSAEILNEEDKKMYEELYKVKEKRATQKFMDKIQGKQPEEVNKMYQRKVFQRKENQDMIPNQKDFKMYIVPCKIGRQEDLALAILNKAQYYNTEKKEKYMVDIGTVLAMRKKYPGQLFIEAKCEKAIICSLDNFNDVYLRRIVPVKNQMFPTLLEARKEPKNEYKLGQFVRIKKGLYNGDLAKIYKIKKNTTDLVLVPRINLQEIHSKMKQIDIMDLSEAVTRQKKDLILQKYTNHRIFYPEDKKPSKKILPQNVFHQFSNLPSNKKITITSQGLILLNFKFDQIELPKGTMLPIQLQPFSKQGNVIQQFLNEQKKNIVTTISFKKGDYAEVIAGQLKKCYGKVIDINGNIIIIRCRNKDVRNKIIQEHVNHLMKLFKEGWRVKVIGGGNEGKAGVVLKLEGPNAIIWTDNDNEIKVNRNNLEKLIGNLQINTLNLVKNNLISTKGSNSNAVKVGIVLQTNKEKVLIMDCNNFVSSVSNLDIDTKIETKHMFAKNGEGDILKCQAQVRIKSGRHEGDVCEVIHPFRDFVFLFDPLFDRHYGIIVERADNCILIGNIAFGARKTNNFHFMSEPSRPQKYNESSECQYKVGQNFTLRSGCYKGYRGIIKSITKDKLQVKLVLKGYTTWIEKNSLKSKEEEDDENPSAFRGFPLKSGAYVQEIDD